MKHIGKLFLLTAAILVLVVVSRFAVTRGQPPVEDNTYSQAFRQMQPTIESVLGEKLTRKPSFFVLSGKQYEAYPGWHIKGFLTFRFPGLSEEQRSNYYHQIQHAVSRTTLVRHLEGSSSIVVIPENKKALFESFSKLKDSTEENVLKAAMVHQIVKMHLESKYDLLNKKYDPKTFEDFAIDLALTEGLTQTFTSKIFNKLGLPEYNEICRYQWSNLKTSNNDPKFQSVFQGYLKTQLWAMEYGPTFIESVTTSPDPMTPQQILMQRPTQTAWIESPGSYRRNIRIGAVGIQKSFENIATDLSPRGFRTFQQTWGPSVLQQVASTLGVRASAEPFLKRWSDGQSIMWLSSENPNQYLAISAIQFDSPKVAKKYLGFAVDLQRKKEEWMAKSAEKQSAGNATRFRSITVNGTTEALMSERESTEPNGSSPSATTILCLRGNTVVEANWNSIPADVPWLERAIAYLPE